MTAATGAGPAFDGRAVWLARALEAACAALLAFMAGMLAWTLAVPASVVPVDDAAPAAALAARSAPAIDRSVLWRGEAFAASGAPVAMAQDAPATTLNLQLFGLVAGVGDTPGSAIIRTPDNRQHAFREGETVIDGVVLRRVLADRALIDRNGVAESLFFPDAPQAQIPAQTQAQIQAQPGLAAAAPAGLTAAALYDSMQFEAETRGGRVVGLRLVSTVDPAILARAGLMQGDVLLEIDGRALAEVSDFSDLFEDLRGATSAAIVVERAGAQIPLTVTFGTPQ